MSLIAIGLLAAIGQTEIPDAPIPSLGSSASFQESVKATAELLEAGDFGAAAKRAATLPRTGFSIKLDTKGLDPVESTIAKNALSAAIDRWKAAMSELMISTTGKPDIVISFTRETMPQPNEPENSLTLFVSPDPSEPSLEAILNVVRTSKKLPIEQPVYENEFGYIIGSFLGLERQPKTSSVMFRMDGIGARPARPEYTLVRQARENVAAAEILRQAATKKQKLAARYPEAFISTTELKFGTVPQGEFQTMQFDVRNNGRAPLQFEIRPDCSCFKFSYEPNLAPGETSVVTVLMSTADFQGPQDKGLFIYTNDPGKSVQRVGVVGTIQPAYRMVRENPDSIVTVDETGAKLSYYFFSPAGLDIKPLKATVSGATGIATIEPWSGSLADPQFREEAKPRSGYRIDVMLSPSVKGRQLIAVLLDTNSKAFPVIGANFYAQRGIAALPESIYFGDVPSGKNRGFTVLYGTKPDFKVISAESSVTTIKAEAVQLGPGEWKITATLDAKPGTGTLMGTISVKTNDPVTPQILIPVQAYVP